MGVALKNLAVFTLHGGRPEKLSNVVERWTGGGWTGGRRTGGRRTGGRRTGCLLVVEHLLVVVEGLKVVVESLLVVVECSTLDTRVILYHFWLP